MRARKEHFIGARRRFAANIVSGTRPYDLFALLRARGASPRVRRSTVTVYEREREREKKVISGSGRRLNLRALVPKEPARIYRRARRRDFSFAPENKRLSPPTVSSNEFSTARRQSRAAYRLAADALTIERGKSGNEPSYLFSSLPRPDPRHALMK